MELERVRSSMVNAMAYDPQTKVLEVEFSNRKRFRYKDVPEDVYRDVRGAESIGRALREQVIEGGRYPSSAVLE